MRPPQARLRSRAVSGCAQNATSNASAARSRPTTSVPAAVLLRGSRRCPGCSCDAALGVVAAEEIVGVAVRVAEGAVPSLQARVRGSCCWVRNVAVSGLLMDRLMGRRGPLLDGCDPGGLRWTRRTCAVQAHRQARGAPVAKERAQYRRPAPSHRRSGGRVAASSERSHRATSVSDLRRLLRRYGAGSPVICLCCIAGWVPRENSWRGKSGASGRSRRG